MFTRLLRWMRSKLSAITARTPSSSVPLAAQSRDEPDPYSLPAMTSSGTSASSRYRTDGVVDRHRLAVGQVARPAALGARRHAVAQADVGERAAHHHLVVAAARAVRVEVARRHAVRDRGTSRPGCPAESTRPARCDRSSRCRRAAPARGRRGCRPSGGGRRRQPLEERRMPDVGRLLVPREAVARRHLQAPATAASPPNTSAYAARNISAVTRAEHRRLDLLRARPDVAQEDVGARRVLCRAARDVRSMRIVPASA